MTMLKKLAIAAAVTLIGLTSAHAKSEINGTFAAQTLPGTPGDSNLYWLVTNSAAEVANDLDPSVAGSYADVTGQAKHKGDTFTDFFVFNVPDTEDITFYAVGAPGAVKFSQFGLFVFTDGTTIDDQLTPVLPSIEGGTYELTSGTYELDLSGTFLKNGGTFSGLITGTPAVPEPENLALMLAGLGAVGLLARRRKQA